jgi:tight adherence protein C
VAFAFASFLVFLNPELTPTMKMLIVFSACAFGFFLPELVVQYLIQKRQEEIFTGMPDMLDLLVVCVEGGLSIDAAMKKISDEMGISNKTLSQELQIACTAIRLGQTREEALHDLGERTGAKDLKSFASVVIQSERFGTSIADALRIHSEELRIHRRQRAEETAAKTTVKLVFPLIFFIFPAIFVVTAGPAVIKIYERIIVTGF